MRLALTNTALIVGALGCRAPTGTSAPMLRAPSAAEAPTRLRWLPQGSPRFLQREPDGFADVLFGTLRVRVRDDVIETADDQLAAPIEAAAPVSHGWVFVAEDGACAAAESFLGPLTRIGDFPGYYREFAHSAENDQRGRVAVVAADQTAWVSDGGPFAPIVGLGPDRVEQVLFRSERHGAAITDGGVLRCTRDGGAHWQVVPNRGYGAERMSLGRHGFSVLSWGWQTLTDDCQLVDHDLDRDPRPDDDGDAEEPESAYGWEGRTPTLLRLLVHDDLAWRGLLERPPRPDGTVLVDEGDWLTTLDASGRELRRARKDFPPCSLADAGHLARATCVSSGPHGSEDTEVFFIDPRAPRLTRIAATDVPPGIERAMPSDREDLAVAAGPCATAPDPDARATPGAPGDPAVVGSGFDSLCEFSSSTTPGRLRRVTTSFRELVGVYDTRALLSLSDRALGVVDLAAGGDGPLVVETVLTAPEGHTVRAGVAVGGTVTALVRDDAGSLRGVHVGVLGDPMASVPLPDRVDRAVFADRAHGFAWDGRLGHVVRTRDGGRTWEPLLDDPPGAPRSTARDPRNDSPDSMRCNLAHCTLDGRMTIRGWGPLRTGRSFAVRAPSDAAPPTEPGPWFRPDQLPRLRCVSEGAPTRLPPLRPIRAPVGRPSRTLAGRTVEGDVRALVWSDERSRLNALFAWRGRDARGAFATLSRSVELPGDVNAGRAEYLARLTMRPLSLGRARALLTFELENTVFATFVRVDAGGGAAEVPAPLTLSSALFPLRSEAGGFFALYPPEVDGIHGSAEVFTMGERDSVERHRRLVFPRRPGLIHAVRAPGAPDESPPPEARLPMALAERGPVRGGALLVRASSPEFAVFAVTPSPDAEPVRAPWRLVGRMSACRAAPPEDAWTLTIPAPSDVLPLAPEDAGATQVIVESSATGVCLRGAQRVGADAAVSVTVAADGALLGLATDHATQRRVRCTLP